MSYGSKKKAPISHATTVAETGIPARETPSSTAAAENSRQRSNNSPSVTTEGNQAGVVVVEAGAFQKCKTPVAKKNPTGPQDHWRGRGRGHGSEQPIKASSYTRSTAALHAGSTKTPLTSSGVGSETWKRTPPGMTGHGAEVAELALAGKPSYSYSIGRVLTGGASGPGRMSGGFEELPWWEWAFDERGIR